MQVDVFAYEYSGYGHATGKPCEENVYSDARAALACLRDGFKLKPERDVVLYGAPAALPPSWSPALRSHRRARPALPSSADVRPTPPPGCTLRQVARLVSDCTSREPECRAGRCHRERPGVGRTRHLPDDQGPPGRCDVLQQRRPPRDQHVSADLASPLRVPRPLVDSLTASPHVRLSPSAALPFS